MLLRLCAQGGLPWCLEVTAPPSPPSFCRLSVLAYDKELTAVPVACLPLPAWVHGMRWTLSSWATPIWSPLILLAGWDPLTCCSLAVGGFLTEPGADLRKAMLQFSHIMSDLGNYPCFPKAACRTTGCIRAWQRPPLQLSAVTERSCFVHTTLRFFLSGYSTT